MIVLGPSRACAQEVASERDAAYVQRFKDHFTPSLEEYANEKTFDLLYLSQIHIELGEIPREDYVLAWGLGPWLLGLNGMLELTGAERYYEANLRLINALREVRDDRIGRETWKGLSLPAWSSGKYAKRGRAVFAVHTGVLTRPIFEFLHIVDQHPELRADLGDQYDAILQDALEALAVHDEQWREGPGEHEGHYIGKDQEDHVDGRILPANRLSAMGCAHWFAWKVSGDEMHHERALRMGRYIRNRLALTPEGAYFWEFWLPEEPVEGLVERDAFRGEDVSHSGLTIALPKLLIEAGEVFEEEDMARFAKTVTHGFGRLGGGVIFGEINGLGRLRPAYAKGVSRYLFFAQADPEVRERVLPYYIHYRRLPGVMDTPLLMKWGAAQEAGD
jgi:hypothetical protein